MTTPNFQASSCQSEIDEQAIGFSEARRIVAGAIGPLPGTEALALRSALGRILAKPVIAPVDVPPHRNSAMDGFALLGADLPTEGAGVFPVVGTSWAGKPFAGVLPPGSCVRIMTGAKLPKGADTVVIQEQTEAVGDDSVRIGTGNRTGQNIREPGEDIARGSTVLHAGRRIGPAQLGLLASLGVAEVQVRRRPRVAFFSTGDELRSVGEPLGEGEIYDSNRYTLYGMLSELGVDILDLGVVRDRRDDIVDALRRASHDADLVLTTGGVSVGEADYIEEATRELGTILFSAVAMKPGRPLTFGRLADASFFGLPGNPVAVMVAFYQFVRPALKLMSGEDGWFDNGFRLPCSSRLRKSRNRTEIQRGIFGPSAGGGLGVRSTGQQGSGVLSSMSSGNCFILLPEQGVAVEPGDLVEVQPFDLLR